MLGVAYAGAITALEQHYRLQDVKRVAGTSSGAIFASLVCLGYNAHEIQGIAREIDFKGFGSHWNPLRLFTKYGIYSGDKFLYWIKAKIKCKTGCSESTFQDLMDAGMKEIKLFATDLNTRKIQEFSYGQTPDIKLAEALRASMSVPLFFNAWQFPDGKPSNHIFVDGGVLFCYPITCFGEDLTKTIGFYLYNQIKEDSNLKYGHLSKYMGQLFKTMEHAQDVDFAKDQQLKAATVQINDFGISPTDLKITTAQKDKLIEIGYTATIQYFEGQS